MVYGVQYICYALDHGINYIDLAGGHAAIFPGIGKALEGRREKLFDHQHPATDETKGKCVYCKHCHPCPAGIDIGLVNKYYDLSRLGDTLAKEHYKRNS